MTTMRRPTTNVVPVSVTLRSTRAGIQRYRSVLYFSKAKTYPEK